jgi:hypothetical protein
MKREQIGPISGRNSVVPMEVVLDELVEQVAIRNPDFYEYMDGSLLRLK